MTVRFTLNGKSVAVEGDPDKPLLWVIREDLGLTGTKYGCGISQCGACTVHLDGAPTRSCQLPVRNVGSRDVRTIEGLESATAQAVKQAWRKLDVVQCGYCQSGQILAATALLEKNGNPTDTDIDMAMDGNLCRCATYQRIRAAIHDASETAGQQGES